MRWGDAQEEAGFTRNKFQEAFERDFLIEKFIDLIRRTKDRDKVRFPVEGEMLAEKRTADFPHAQAFRQKFGGKSQIAAAILEHCRARSSFEDVIGACEKVIKAKPVPSIKEQESRDLEISGYVYLIKSGGITRSEGPMRSEEGITNWLSSFQKKPTLCTRSKLMIRSALRPIGINGLRPNAETANGLS